MKAIRVLLTTVSLSLLSGCATDPGEFCIDTLFNFLLYGDETYEESWERSKREAGIEPLGPGPRHINY